MVFTTLVRVTDQTPDEAEQRSASGLKLVTLQPPQLVPVWQLPDMRRFSVHCRDSLQVPQTPF
jgi:hypothetical protein